MNNEYRDQRLANLRALEACGIQPYGGAFPRTGRLADLRAAFAADREVRAAGRLTAVRGMGKAVFADLNDGSGRFQVFVKRDIVGERAFEAFRLLDIGDCIGVEGRLFATRTGEPTIEARGWTLLSKALLPLPEKWHGLRDTEQRFRQRYLDLTVNPAVRTRFEMRSAIVREIRAFLHGRGFVEVETPMMQPRAGGAAAEPFVTHCHSLNADLFLRIAPEIYLKQLLVGGFDRVFELNRNFRNEGFDRTHVPEFTMLEAYEAYGDLQTMRTLVQDLIGHVAQTVCGQLTIAAAGETIDLTPPFREVAYRELVRQRLGGDWFELDAGEQGRRAAAQGLAIDPAWDSLLITHEVYEKLIEKSLWQPTLVTRLPAALIPLARPCADDPSCADVFELVIAGQEIAPAYSELNDPLEQRRRLTAQAAGDESRLDEDFLTALEHGMPPAGGMGLGVDRLAMILTGAESLRDVILFPMLRPGP